MTNELPEYPCPTCGQRGCVGLCEPEPDREDEMQAALEDFPPQPWPPSPEEVERMHTAWLTERGDAARLALARMEGRLEMLALDLTSAAPYFARHVEWLRAEVASMIEELKAAREAS